MRGGLPASGIRSPRLVGRREKSPARTREEAADIRKKLEEGWRGPVLLTWLYRLLGDREERVRFEREREVKGPRGDSQ